jgi:hypothetical protein
MADAPSFSTSTRSIAANGIWLTSTAEPPWPWLDTRRPFRRISVADGPCPRRFAADNPFLPRESAPTTSELDARLSLPLPLVDRKAMSCSGLLIPSRTMSWFVMICRGSALRFGSWRMRDPVTTISPASGLLLPTLAEVTGVSAPVGVAAGSVTLPVVLCAAAGEASTSASASPLPIDSIAARAPS